jgi:hypothetical protein
MAGRPNEQTLVESLLKRNPEVVLVLEIARRAKLVEERSLPLPTAAPTDTQATPMPEHQGSLATPPAIQKA